MKVDVKKERWIAIDGSIFTERTFPITFESGVKHQLRVAIAFNVARVADHIVTFHNESLHEAALTQEGL